MTDFFYSQQAAELQANHDKVSATTGALKDENNTQVENRFKGNQNWNVPGADGSLTGTPQTFTVGQEFSAGRFVVGSSLVNTYYSGGIFDADSGSYYIEYDGDFTGDFYGIKLADGTITQTGCTLSLESGNTRLTVDMSVAPAHKFAGFSESQGIWPDVSDDDSERTHRGGYLLIENSNGRAEIYPDGKIVQYGEGGFSSSSPSTIEIKTLPIPFPNEVYLAIVGAFNNDSSPTDSVYWNSSSTTLSSIAVRGTSTVAGFTGFTYRIEGR